MHAELLRLLFFFFFNDTATTEIYTLSLHDALPISGISNTAASASRPNGIIGALRGTDDARSEEHTSELQSHVNLVCRLLLEKKKKKITKTKHLNKNSKNLEAAPDNNSQCVTTTSSS